MKASNYLVAHSDKEKGAVVVSMKPSSGWITIIGATCPVGRAGNSFYVSPERGKEDIVIVSVTQVESGKHGRVLHHDFILPLRWFGGSPEVDLDTDWVPRADRLPTICDHSDLEVAYEGKPFTTSEYRAEDEGKILIERTLLCQFLNGDVEVGALLAVANERLAEQRATEKLAEAQARIRKLETQYEHAWYLLRRVEYIFITPFFRRNRNLPGKAEVVKDVQAYVKRGCRG